MSFVLFIDGKGNGLGRRIAGRGCARRQERRQPSGFADLFRVLPTPASGSRIRARKASPGRRPSGSTAPSNERCDAGELIHRLRSGRSIRRRGLGVRLASPRGMKLGARAGSRREGPFGFLAVFTESTHRKFHRRCEPARPPRFRRFSEKFDDVPAVLARTLKSERRHALRHVRHSPPLGPGTLRSSSALLRLKPG